MGLSKICKAFGAVETYDKEGNKVTWLYDYANDLPRLKTEMTKDEIKASNRVKTKVFKN